MGLLAPFAGARMRRAGAVMLTAFGVAAFIYTAACWLPIGARLWIAPAYLAVGYWLPALLVTRPPAAFEAWLRRTERIRGRSFVAAEVAYLLCTPLPPAAFVVVWVTGSIEAVDHFWTAVLLAGFLCYFSLPWLVSRPPRVIEDALVDVSAIRRVNVETLDRFSHGWNTFPSGHVAVSLAAALAVLPVSTPAGIVFVVIAAAIFVGAVWGRYHYSMDALAGVVVALASTYAA
jgi:membrane-associated phospholipid phosphatase